MFTGKKEKELKEILWNYRWKMHKKIEHLYGEKLALICPLAEKIIEDDPYLSLQVMMESSAIKSEKFDDDGLFIQRKFERQFNTVIDYIWILIYKSLSDTTGLGPYATQLFSFKIVKKNGIRILLISGFSSTYDKTVTKSGAIMLFWFEEMGELDSNARNFLPFLLEYYPEPFEKMWQEDRM
jgi:hypothetical protein